MNWMRRSSIALLFLGLGTGLFAQTGLLPIPEQALQVQRELEQQQRAQAEAGGQQAVKRNAKSINLERFIRIKVIGQAIPFYDPNLDTMEYGDFVSLKKKRDGYYIKVLNIRTQAHQEIKVRFVENIALKLRMGSSMTSLRENRSGKQVALQTEQNISSAINPLAGEGDAVYQQVSLPPRTSTRFTDLLDQSETEGEDVEIIVGSTNSQKKGKVFVFDHRLFDESGTPISMMFTTDS